MSDSAWYSNPVFFTAIGAVGGKIIDIVVNRLVKKEDRLTGIRKAEIEDQAKFRMETLDEIRELRAELRKVEDEVEEAKKDAWEWRRRYYRVIGLIQMSNDFADLRKKIGELEKE